LESPVAQSTVTNVTGISTAAPLSLSADGSKSGTGIVWATGSTGGDANQQTVPGILRAFDAADVSKELWNSKQNADRDGIGNYAKFCPPTVANGGVYVATFSGQLHVFGLLPGVCAFSLEQSSRLVTADEGGGNVNIIAGTDCNWLATTNDSWIAITSASDGSGDGAISFSVEPNPSGLMRIGVINIAGQDFTVTQAGEAAVVSAATYDGPQLASESIAVAFGADLATGTAVPRTILPTSLAGTTIKVIDSTGAERLAPLFFASPNQVNYLVPAGTALGPALIAINSASGNITADTVQIARVAPGLFSTDGTGRGLAAAVVLRVKADGKQTYEPVGRFDPVQNSLVALPVDLGPDLGSSSDRVFLILFGTGLRNRRSLADVKTQIGGTVVSAAFVGAQGTLAGLDQINLLLPRSLAGRGKVDVKLTVEGLAANGVNLAIK
ncbi:MAG: BACON domain-containing carbohydrate-binding protein, partial [Acidobacteriota bacterium]